MKAKGAAKRPSARTSPKDDTAKVRDLGEILRVINGSPADAQPVFNRILESAVRLLGASSGTLTRRAGNQIELAALTSTDDAADAALRATFPQSLQSDLTHARAIRDRAPVNISDAEIDPPRSGEGPHAIARARSDRSLAAVPLLHHDEAIGAIAVTRREPGGFTASEIILLQTFADQAVIAIENVRLFTVLQEKHRALTESLGQQTATADILEVISRSPTDVEPVFEAVVASSARLCEAHDVAMLLVDGDNLRLAAGLGPLYLSIPADFRIPLTRGSAATRAVVDRTTVHIHDFAAETEEEYPVGRDLARRFGHRSMLAVPLLREGAPIGVICAFRVEVRPFSGQQIALLRTFADQAVIAIENVRLFTELQQKNEALTAAHAQVTEALDQQTASAEILRVISRSQTDVQPVFDAIVASAVRLCDARWGAVFRYDGALLHVAAHHNFSEEQQAALALQYPMTPTPAHISGRAMLSGATVQIPDIARDEQYGSELAAQYGYRSLLGVPMLRAGAPIGVIVIYRKEPGPFADQHIALLQTFADQAVIAIENVRLFTELQTSNRELTMALDTQTATSDILRVISRSQTDVQPAFDAILASAIRLLGGYSGGLTTIVGDHIEVAAITSTDPDGDAAQRALYPQPLESDTSHGQAIRSGAPINVADAQADLRFPEMARAAARARGFRSQVAVPLLRHDEPLGAITITRREAGGFTDDEIALLQTFADQAVIAIENVRLFTELQARTAEMTRSVERLTALRDVGQAVSSSLDLETVLNTIIARAVQLAGAHSGTIWEYDTTSEEFVLRITQNVQHPELRARRTARIRRGEGAVGRLALTGAPVQIPDITAAGAYEGRLREALVSTGTRALLAVPLLHEDRLVGGLVMSRRTPGEFPREAVDLLIAFATQSALAIQNARLFLEIEDKSRQLEAASRHKSEFLANMSHELRTPLNAIIGFSEVLAERMFGELNDKQDEYLKDIYASGQHLLSLINDILDLSKIEAGRMELEPADFDLPGAIDNALTLVRERAGRRGITLGREIDERVGMIRGDERKVKQVLLNLLSNALKFTPEGGRIDVRATVSEGLAEVSVADTGVGIAPEDQEVVFEEFRQVGTADKKVEGTGLGLALSRKFIELHGGRIWVKSQVGHGSTFTFTLPVRQGE